VAKPFLGEEEEAAVIEVLRSGWLSQGPRVAEFEKRFAEYVGASHAVAVSSCTTGLHLSLVALNLMRGDEVLCPSLSFIATANAIRYTGATPVFVDVARHSFNMDPGLLEESMTPRTRAILVVHQVGMPAPMQEICEIAARHGLAVIEDAACAAGSTYRDRRIGAPLSRAACFSFHPRKVLTTGEGGMITTSDPEFAARLRRLRQHAMSMSDLARHSATDVAIESYDEVGFNARMTDMQAAVGIVQLSRLDQFVARRRELAGRYTRCLGSVPWLIPPVEPEYGTSNYQSYMVRLTATAPVSRDDFMRRLLHQGVSVRRGVMAIHRETPYRHQYWEERLPETNKVTDRTVILPLYHAMTEAEQDLVIEAICDMQRHA
jgi:dTDP-4-amino-4,6-dideoxygalactose transaminase